MLAGVGHEHGDVAAPAQPLDAGLHRGVVDPAVPEHEQDDRLVVRVGLDHRRGKPGPGDELADRRRRPPAGGGAGAVARRAAPRRSRWLGGVVAGRAASRRRRRRSAPRRGRSGWRSSPLEPLSATTRVSSRKATTTARTPSTAIWTTGLSFRAFLTSMAPPRAAAARPKEEGPNLPTPLGLRTLLRRWASTGGPQVAHRKPTPKPIVLAHNWSGYRTSSSLA